MEEKKGKTAFDDTKIERFQKEILEKAKNKDFEKVPDTFMEYLKIKKENKKSTK